MRCGPIELSLVSPAALQCRQRDPARAAAELTHSTLKVAPKTAPARRAGPRRPARRRPPAGPGPSQHAVGRSASVTSAAPTAPRPAARPRTRLRSSASWCGASRCVVGSSSKQEPANRRQRACQQHTLALAAGEFVQPPPGKLSTGGLGHRRRHCRPRRRCRAHRKGHATAGGPGARRRRRRCHRRLALLRQQAVAAPVRGRQCLSPRPARPTVRCRLAQPGQQLQQRALAAPFGPTSAAHSPPCSASDTAFTTRRRPGAGSAPRLQQWRRARHQRPSRCRSSHSR